MNLNDFGKIAYDEWIKLSGRHLNILLDVFQIMPNHIHSIIALAETPIVGATLAVAHHNNTVAHHNNEIIPNGNRAGASPAPTVGDVVGAYKSLVANKCLAIYKSRNEYMGKLWQRNYWEHIIRNEKSYQRIADYIVNNPANWKNDKFYME
jgi:REP element-mobilizing transposase RayT